MSATPVEPIYYEVPWGIADNERTVRVDYGDDMAYSRDAEANATRVFLEFVNAGRKVEFCVNGVHKAGYDFAAEWAEWDRWCAEQDAEEAAERVAQASVVHKTTTWERSSLERHWFVKPNGRAKGWRPDSTIAGWACSCGEKGYAGDRREARTWARRHRKEMTA